MRLYDTYDYVIIGSGSAGSAIANRLGEDYRLRILVLEAGPADSSFLLKMPAGFASLGETSPYNWRYETVPQIHCNNRRMYWPRGKTLGGSSSINAMLYVRGHAWDYDHWRQLGNEGWSYQDVLPFFKKAENNERGGDEFHGTGGPLNVADQTDPSPLNDSFLKACEQAGHDQESQGRNHGQGSYALLKAGVVKAWIQKSGPQRELNRGGSGLRESEMKNAIGHRERGIRPGGEATVMPEIGASRPRPAAANDSVS